MHLEERSACSRHFTALSRAATGVHLNTMHSSVIKDTVVVDVDTLSTIE